LPGLTRPSPLANRVDPFGRLHADTARGGMMGNRGGRIHDPVSGLASGRAYASRRWIVCCLCFRGRRRAVWGEGYTELFFLDEPTALAAGHRPCFECRREAAEAFRAVFPRGEGMTLPDADAIDRRLHAERFPAEPAVLDVDAALALPDGAMLAIGGVPVARRDGAFRAWSFGGYGAVFAPAPGSSLLLLTPPATVRALAAGYRPDWCDGA
jgi:hypothetical protein